MTTMAQPPKRPARERPELMTREEEAADAAAPGAERQGAVAFHHGKARDAPVPSAKRIFLCASVGLQAMTRRARVRTGWTCPRPWPRASRAFREGLYRDECPGDIKRDGKKWSEWLQGCERGEREGTRRGPAPLTCSGNDGGPRHDVAQRRR